MRVAVNVAIGDALEFDIPDDLTIRDLKALIVEETGAQGVASIFLHRQGAAITDDAVLSSIDPGNDEVSISMINTNRLIASTTQHRQTDRARQARQQRVLDEALTNALEEHPESFIQVCMLYVPVFVNGVQCLGFVDTGAQQSIMSNSLARRASIDHLIDPRLKGRLIGVGQAETPGRIMSTPIKIGDGFYPSSFSVLPEGTDGMDTEIILGLDFLRRHRARVDLGARSLTLSSGREEYTIPFLEEQQLPEDKRPKHAAVFSQMPGETQRPPPQQQALAMAVLEGKVGQLVAMGFDAGRARSALVSAQGDLDRALTQLLSE
ncbi:Aspartyl protease [Carpediemonas membranifera]|uniref:Aspartyl protease n=1 Tax=Carpediemonas membranifera TaxID=201153 RepID=A0A8J6BWW3_9EUKA|nr:Aspartyl protease [Carpediemonas membranifera]|eukprot:KAG9392826.1 Aspartyl protease [Carpediemonas membranifera]